MWELKSNFDLFKTKAFIDNIPQIVGFMEKEFSKTKQRDNIKKGLEIWSSIVLFIQIKTIDDESK